MLWELGAMVLLIDYFYRISVPIDHLFNFNEGVGGGNQFTITVHPHPDKHMLPYSLVIDDKGLALLLEHLNISKSKGDKWLLSLQKQEENGTNVLKSPLPLSQTALNIKRLNDGETVSEKMDTNAEISTSHFDEPQPPTEDVNLAKHSITPAPYYPPPIPSYARPVGLTKEKNHHNDGSISHSEETYQGKEAGPQGAYDFQSG